MLPCPLRARCFAGYLGLGPLLLRPAQFLSCHLVQGLGDLPSSFMSRMQVDRAALVDARPIRFSQTADVSG